MQRKSVSIAVEEEDAKYVCSECLWYEIERCGENAIASLLAFSKLDPEEMDRLYMESR